MPHNVKALYSLALYLCYMLLFFSPTGSTKEPSIAFCLLLRLLTLRCTEKQMQLLLDHPDSPYIRAIGFLYLRYAGDPNTLYDTWIKPYIYDQEPIQVKANASKHQPQSYNQRGHGSNNKNNNGDDVATIGDFVRRLFSDKNYYGTILPRLPIHIERDIQVKMLQAEKIEERAKKHASNKWAMDHFTKIGSKVMALYGDEENPVQWYEAVIDRVLTTDPETSLPLRHPKFIVTFPEYMNTETVTLGELEMPGSQTTQGEKEGPRASLSRNSRIPDRDHGRGGGGHIDREYGRGTTSHIDRGYGNGYSDSRRGYNENRGRGYSQPTRDRDTDRGRGRDHPRGYRDEPWDRDRNQRPLHSIAASIPSDGDLYEEVRRRERENVTSNSRNAIARRPPSTKASLATPSSSDIGHRSHSPPREPLPPRERRTDWAETNPSNDSTNVPAPKKRTAEEMAAIQEKKRKLMAKYG